jgi:hypothetical protein
MEEILTKYIKARDIMVDLDALKDLDNADHIQDATELIRIVNKIVGSEVQSDGILLLANKLAYLNDQPNIWYFYQDVIVGSTDRLQSAYLIALAAAHQDSRIKPIVVYNVTRLIYSCISLLMENRSCGHSNLRIGCARILILVGQHRDASWVLRELRYILSIDEECEKELSFIANNRSVLEEIASDGPTRPVRVLAKHILQTAGLWKANPSL